MHEFRRFIQKHLDDQGLRQADLVARSGLTRSHVSKLLRDHREHLGQMPDDETLEALATGFGIPVERVRTAAARSLVGYIDDGSPITLELGEISTDALLNELKRRIEASGTGARNVEDTQPRTQEGSTEHSSAGRGARRPGAPMKLVKGTDRTDENQGGDLDLPPIFDEHELAAARDEGVLSEEKQRRLKDDENRP